MAEPTTCGQGLADNAGLPARLADLTAAMGSVLEQHMTALDLTDPRSKAEHAVYEELASAHRRIADWLRATAERMAGQSDLPMGTHDLRAIRDPATTQAFETLVHAKRNLLDLLRETAEADHAMLDTMRSA